MRAAGRRLVEFLATAAVRVVQGVLRSLQFSFYIRGRDLTRQLDDYMPYFVGVDARELGGGQLF